MKSVLISIRPKWVKKIASGEKTIEVRRNRPKIETPFKCYIYCTKQRLTKRTTNMYSYLHINESRVQKDYGKITTWGKIGDVIVNEWLDNYKYISYGMHGKVIGEFICGGYDTYGAKLNHYRDIEFCITEEQLEKACLSYEKFYDYAKLKERTNRYAIFYGELYGWHISDLKIYDKPKELSEFQSTKKCPQAYYQEETGDWFCEDGETEDAVIDKEKEFPYEDECAYFNCPRCGGENYEYEDYAYCSCDGYKPLTRAPRSWQFVKEIK